MTNWMKRLVAGLMWPAALLAGFAFAAPAAEEQERSIVLSYWAQTESAALDLVYYRMCREYEDANPDVKINLNMVSSNSDVFLKTMDDAKKGVQPEADVAMLTLFALGDRAAKGEVLNLDSRVLEWADRSDFSPSVLGLGRYRGALVGIGYYPTPELFVYRKDYFKEAGLDPDNPPKTWEEIAAAAEKLTKRDASGKVTRAGFDIPAQSAHINHLESFMRQNGAKIIDPITEAIDINGAAAVEAADWMIALKNRNVSIPYSIAKYDVPFLRGDSAMSQVKSIDIAAMFKADPGMRDKVGFMHVPVRKAPGRSPATSSVHHEAVEAPGGSLEVPPVRDVQGERVEALQGLRHRAGEEVAAGAVHRRGAGAQSVQPRVRRPRRRQARRRLHDQFLQARGRRMGEDVQGRDASRCRLAGSLRPADEGSGEVAGAARVAMSTGGGCDDR